MKIEIRQRDRRALLGLAVALVCYVLLTQVVLPGWNRLGDPQATAEDQQDRLRRYRRALLQQGRRAELEEVVRARTLEVESRLIQVENPALASAELQSRVEAAIVNGGIALGQRNIVGATRLDDFVSQTAMTVTFECSPSQLRWLLSEFRAAEKFLVVSMLQVIPIQQELGPAEGQNLHKGLRVTLTVAALMPSF